MVIKARIDNGIVAEILDSGDNPFPDFNPLITWVECTSNTLLGDLYDGTIFSSPPGPTNIEIWSALQRAASALLLSNDLVAIRCFKAGIDYPQEWRDYDISLRAILHTSSDDPLTVLPIQPVTSPVGI